MDYELEALNARFSLPERLRFTHNEAGLPVAELTLPEGTARVAVQGAQVLFWQPADQSPVIWVSKAAIHQPGKAVRGGVPICWPWFGAMQGQSAAHGFVRTRLWAVRETLVNAKGQVQLCLGIQDDATTRAQWDYPFDLSLRVTLGTTLTLELITHNTGPQAFTLTAGLHTYFCVGDISQTAVQGLDSTDYLDKLTHFSRAHQTGPVRFCGETDRVYIHTTADCLIEDAAWGRTLRVAKAGSTSTVVWNPWAEKEKSLGDMAAGEYQNMLCVETVNTGPDQVTVAPDGQHTLMAEISVTTGTPTFPPSS